MRLLTKCGPVDAGEGLITYMRTDGLQLAGSAVADIRRTAQAEYGQDAVPDSPRWDMGQLQQDFGLQIVCTLYSCSSSLDSL